MARDLAGAAPAVDIGEYAEILGRTWLGGEDSVARELAARSLAPTDWESARTHWTAAIDDEMARGGQELVLLFAARFEASRRDGAAGPAGRPAPPAAQPADTPMEGPAVALAVPTYMAAPTPDTSPRGSHSLPVASSNATATPAHLAQDACDVTLPPLQRTGPALPFAPTGQGAVPAAVEALRGAGRREPDAPSADGDETAFLPASALRDKLALPFQGASLTAAPPPELSLREYARFLVAFAAAKDADADAVRSRFGIASVAMQQTMGTAFAARFERDPAERAEFKAILTELRGEGTR